MASQDLNLNSILFQNQLRSKPIRENFTDIQNNFNALRAEVNAGIASTASEVTSARDGYDTLSKNINARQVWGGGVATGGVVLAQGTPNNTVYVNTGAGICPNGVGVEWDGASSNTVAAVTKPRYIVAVVNSDNTLSLELGATADDPFLPPLTNTQRALGIIYQGTASPAVFNNSDIKDARRQGCLYNDKYYFKINDAVNDVLSTLGGKIEIGAGHYYEDVDLKGKSNLELRFNTDANLYRIADSNYAIQCLNTASSVQTNLKIKGGNFDGNGKQGNKELIKIDYTDELTILGSKFDNNNNSTATYINLTLDNCNDFLVDNISLFDGVGSIDRQTANATASNNIKGNTQAETFHSETFTSSGIFYVPWNVKRVVVTLWGGGGGGGGSSNNGLGAGGGGSSESIYRYSTEVTPNATIAVTIGSGGAGGASGSAGSNGGVTSFGSLVNANGGLGGAAGVDDNNDGGNGGSAFNSGGIGSSQGGAATEGTQKVYSLGGSGGGCGDDLIGGTLYSATNGGSMVGVDDTYYSGGVADSGGGGAAGFNGNGATGGALDLNGSSASANSGAGGGGSGEDIGGSPSGGAGGSGGCIVEWWN
jgi:hypothetical protein